MKNKKLLAIIGGAIAIILIIVIVIVLTGKNKDKKDDTATATDAITTEITTEDTTEATTEEVNDEPVNKLTGLPVDEAIANQRPVAVMINNIKAAMPQSGIENADITYEILVEGGITRFMCVFKDYANLPKLGPVRSARHYYIELADMYDWIYAHIGYSVLAHQMVIDKVVDSLDGMGVLSNSMFYRDDTRVAPHNCYIDGPRTVDGIAYCGYAVDYQTEEQELFKFNKEDTPIGSGMSAKKVTTIFNSGRQPYFEYHEDDGKYYRFQDGGPQIDDQSGNQLSYKNIIIMFVAYSTYAEGDYTRMDVDWLKGGTGYYCSDGEYTSISWKNDNGVIRYYGEDGELLMMNPGQTFITVFDENIPDNIVFE
ncbi:MAG: DUF3048 domain-containing protein [Wujia sp.]